MLYFITDKRLTKSRHNYTFNKQENYSSAAGEI